MKFFCSVLFERMSDTVVSVFIILCLIYSVTAEVAESAEVGRNDLRIVGGEDTEIYDHPYTVSIQYFGNHNCGGSIISPSWILTAGHCFGSNTSLLLAFLTIRAGSSYHRGGGTVRNTSRLVIHEAFTPSTYDSDIALVQLASPLTYSDYIQPIGLPEQGYENKPGTPAVVVGWGNTKTGGNLADKLQQVSLIILPDDACAQIYKEQFTRNMICAHDLAGGKDSCNGDSGGPLVAGGQQLGVVSAGASGTCGEAALPGIYTRVAEFTHWIQRNALM